MHASALTLSIDSSFDHVFLVGLVVRQIALFAGLSPEESARVELCAVEAVNNAVQHAYEGRPGGVVEIEVRLAPDALHLEVRDHGRAMDPKRLESAGLPPDDRTLLDESGRGLRILHAAMDEVAYRSAPSGNCLRLSKRIPGR